MSMFNMMFYKEAIASVALSHPSKCACKICLASLGDEDALRQVLQEVYQEELRRETLERR